MFDRPSSRLLLRKLRRVFSRVHPSVILLFGRRPSSNACIFIVSFPLASHRSPSHFLAVFPTLSASTFHLRPPLPRKLTTTLRPPLVSFRRRRYRRRNSRLKARSKARRRWRSDGQRRPRRAFSTRRHRRPQEESRRWSPSESRTPNFLTSSPKPRPKQERPWRSSCSTSAQHQFISPGSNRRSS